MTETTDGWIGCCVGDDHRAARYHNFFSLGFFGFSALRFIVAVITTLSVVLAPGLRPLAEIHVRFVGAAEPDPGSQLFVMNEPHAIFLFLKHERSERLSRALEAGQALHARMSSCLDATDNGWATSEHGLSGYCPGQPAAAFSDRAFGLRNRRRRDALPLTNGSRRQSK
jgi:hypothetical protein